MSGLGWPRWLVKFGFGNGLPNRELLGWQLSKTGKASTAVSALEHALINRLLGLGKVPERFFLRPDNGLVFTSRKYTALVKSYGLQQEFIIPHCPQ